MSDKSKTFSSMEAYVTCCKRDSFCSETRTQCVLMSNLNFHYSFLLLYKLVFKTIKFEVLITQMLRRLMIKITTPRSPKDDICLCYDPAICPWKFPYFRLPKAVSVFIAAPHWKPPKCPLTGGWISPWWYLHIMDTIQQQKGTNYGYTQPLGWISKALR